MQIRIFHTLILFITLLFSSCGKGVFGPPRVDGSVKDATTGDPVYGATVYLLEAESSIDLFGPPPSFYSIDSITTGAFGRFEFTYNDRDGYRYAVFAHKSNFIDNPGPEDILNLGGGSDVEVLIYPEAFLKVRVHNINEYDAWDYLSLSGINISPQYGNSIDTIVIGRLNGNYSNRLVWGVVDDGVPPIMNESVYIYCPAFDTTYYEIFY